MKYTNAWYWDGSWRDICVQGVAIADWQRVVDWLRAGPYPVEFLLGGEPAPLPADVSPLFALSNEIGVLMSVDLEGTIANCHFFWHKEIEFDIDPRQVNSEEREEAIADFMRALGRAVGKDVILTPENWHRASFLRYDPERDEIIHFADTSLEPIESRQLSREEAFRLMAKGLGVDENDEAAVIRKLLEKVNKPAYPED
ncbi:MAG: hypothetical protein ACJ78Q_01885 [Chloroflexia bacterium]